MRPVFHFGLFFPFSFTDNIGRGVLAWKPSSFHKSSSSPLMCSGGGVTCYNRIKGFLYTLLFKNYNLSVKKISLLNRLFLGRNIQIFLTNYFLGEWISEMLLNIVIFKDFLMQFLVHFILYLSRPHPTSHLGLHKCSFIILILSLDFC